jgi:hypothetical protein
MRTIFFILQSAIFALLCSCAPWQIGAERNVVLDGIAFKSCRQMEDGTVLGVLAEDTVINGWPCDKGFVAFHDMWRLDELQLSQTFNWNGIELPEKTWVFLDTLGRVTVCMFPHDMVIHGFPCRGSWMGKEGIMTTFYPNGQLKFFCPPEDLVIQGVPCSKSLFAGIELYPSGQLKRCRLSDDFTLEDRVWAKGTVLAFTQTGKVVTGRLMIDD